MSTSRFNHQTGGGGAFFPESVGEEEPAEPSGRSI
jgi:hypothetical protein